MTPIGYYNPFQHPVSFTGSKGNMIEVSPNTPVTDKDGFLIASSPVLDKQVSDGVLKRIYDTHPNFRDHDKKVEKKKGVTRFTKAQVDQMPIQEVAKITKNSPPQKKNKAPPELLLDSRIGVVELGGWKIPEDAEVGEDGTVKYKNKRFASTTALKAYMASSRDNSPNPLSVPIKS